MRKFRLLKYVYDILNRLDTKFFRKNYPEYQSKFANQVLIVTALSFGLSILLTAIELFIFNDYDVSERAMFLSDNPLSQTGQWNAVILIGSLVVYECFFLARQWRFLAGPWRKIGYVLFCTLFLVVLGPHLFPTLVVLILLAIAFRIALFLLSIALSIIAMFSGGSSKGGRWRLDNGDTVKESSGLFGEKYYTGESGRSYDRNSDDTFSAK